MNKQAYPMQALADCKQTGTAKSLEESLDTLNIRCRGEEERLKSLTTSHRITGDECSVLTYIVRCTEQARCGRGGNKHIIQGQEIRPFMEYASHLFDRLCSRLHVTLRYAWFCQWLCTKYIFCRQCGSASG